MSGASVPTDQQHPLFSALPGPAQEVDPGGPELHHGPQVAADAALPDMLQAFSGPFHLQSLSASRQASAQRGSHYGQGAVSAGYAKGVSQDHPDAED